MAQFRIEQIALAPQNIEKAKALLSDLGITGWTLDRVSAKGEVYGKPASNEANLSFNYDSLKDAYELEMLEYTDGEYWFDEQEPCVSHFGMHVNEQQLDEFAAVFKKHDIAIAQQVRTISHTNAKIKGVRWYEYVIYETFPILGVDLKFILRKSSAPE